MRGFILITSLLILTVLTVLGLAFSALVTRDLYFARRQELGTQAFYLARAGIEYYMARGLPDQQGDGSHPVIYPSDDQNSSCELEIRGKLLVSTGILRDSSEQIVHTRTLVSPLWSLGTVYEISEGK